MEEIGIRGRQGVAIQRIPESLEITILFDYSLVLTLGKELIQTFVCELSKLP